MTVGVKFCGNCNPQFDAERLLKTVEAGAPELDFVHWDGQAYGVLLVVNSCPVGCATIPEHSVPMVMVTSDAVDGRPVAADELPAAVVQALCR